MSHHTATLQNTCQTLTTLYNASLAISDLLYWVDDEYFQPFVKWAAPRLQDAAVTALVWTVVFVIRFCLWLMDTIEQWAATDAIAIALMAWAQAYAPAEDVLALAPAAVVSVDAPGHGWRGWITRQLTQALLPTVEMAIKADEGNGDAIDPWQEECDSEFSQWTPVVPPAKSTQTSVPSSKRKSKKSSAKPAQKPAPKGTPQSSRTARSPRKPAQTPQKTNR
jgi:hypothetical protein